MAARIGKAEQEEVTKWRTRIKVAETFRAADNRKTAWRNMKKYYRNLYDEKVFSVNLIFSYGRQMVPFLYFKNPVVECTALWRGWERKAKILEAVDNMLLEKMRVKEQLKLIIQDTFLYDYGIRKVGYDSEFGYDPQGVLWKDLFKEVGVEVTDEEAKEYNTYILKEFPFFLRVPPSRFFVDPDTDGPGLETARWVVEEFYRPLEDVIEDDRYERVPRDLRASHVLNQTDAGVVISPNKEGNIDATGRSRDFERVRLYEIWDKKHRKVWVLCDNHDGFLREQDDVWGYRNFFPYDRLCFNPVSDEHYSTSDAMYIERQQLELNDVRTQESNHRKKENLKIIGRRNALRPEEKAKFESGQVGPYIEADVPPGTPVGGEFFSPTPNMSRDIYNVGDIARKDMQEILAFGQNQLAGELGRRKTATEATVIDQYAQLRSDERRDIVGDFLGRAVHDVNTLLFKFWDAEDVIEVAGPEGSVWEEWTGQSVAGEYAVRILPNSTLPMTKDLYRRKTGELVMKYRNDPYINQKELRRVDLDAYEEFDTNALLVPDPAAPQIMMDYRPGQGKREEGEGSRINIPENPMVEGISQMVGEEAGASPPQIRYPMPMGGGEEQ